MVRCGRGSRIWTSDGREMLDFSMGWGSALPGHARREIAEAVTEQVRQGANFAYVTEQSLALAEEIIRLSPACEAVRFCASGTEATMYCLRLARAATRRTKVLKFEGAYHGAHDIGVASLFPPQPPDFPQAAPFSAGVDSFVVEHTLVAPFNDVDFATTLIERCGDELAGVIVEPLQRCLPPAPEFLPTLREATRRCGALLVFDEVVTGFRLAYGGAQQYYSVTPDLVAYGKALGGGLPIGAFGGRRDIMDLVREDRMGRSEYVWTASTSGGNPVSTAAANAALALYRMPGAYERLHALGQYLRNGLSQTLLKYRITGQILGDGPLAQVAFTPTEARDYRSSRHRDAAFARRVMLELFARDVFINPMSTKFYLSLAHDEQQCDAFCDRFGDALQAALG
ncbi:MAG TPA: aminotransferase class III-fold pyridoxal phosphate-dependent enzyme [Lacipirellulaceae bacterium]|nr:aminotransferase class III-fold pyridoxal phosphate-dependent enzyme [Lacipirellulaceae bacterium]